MGDHAGHHHEEDTEEGDANNEAQTGDEAEGNVVIIVIAICLIIIIGGLSALFGLHYKRKLHPCFYRMFSPRWKPVQTDMDVEEDEDKHTSIIKNGLNVSELGPMGEGANVNGDMTTVTFVGEKEEEDVKKELVEATEEKEEKKDNEKKVEKEEEAKEDTPLQEDEENVSK